MPVRERRGDAAARGALQEALLDQERLEHVLDRVALLADRGGEVVDADRPAGEFLDDGRQQLAVHHVEPRASTSSIDSAASATSRVTSPSARTSA